MLDHLDHLELLDDAAPPPADAAMLTRVRHRADQQRRRNRLTIGSAIVVPLVIIAGVAVIVGSRHTTNVVDVAPPTSSSKPTTYSGGSSAGTLPNGLHIEMTLARPAVQLGRDIGIRVVVRNDTSASVAIGNGDLLCALRVGPQLDDAAGKSPADKPPSGPACLMNTAFPPGKTATFISSLPTKRVGFKRGAYHGHYTVALVDALIISAGGGGPEVRWSLKPVPIEIDAPALTARLALSYSQVVAGGTIAGSVFFDNASGSPIDAGCVTHPDYQVGLAAGGAVIANPAARLLNPSAPCAGRRLLLEPGPMRLPFRISAKYFGCDSGPTTDPTGLPQCLAHRKIPSLPGGEYEVTFTGAGALGAVEVAPAPVLVVVPNNQK